MKCKIPIQMVSTKPHFDLLRNRPKSPFYHKTTYRAWMGIPIVFSHRPDYNIRIYCPVGELSVRLETRHLDRRPLAYILISAALFGLSAPLAKLLLGDISPVVLAGLLYIGAFLGLFGYSLISAKLTRRMETSPALERTDIPWLAGAILAGGVLAPISMMMGLNLVSGFSASLLLNLEGVCTVIIAVFIFKENVGKRIWLALLLMTVAGVLLSWDSTQGKFSLLGPLLIVLATFCWGIDNNLTRHISDKDPVQITWIKGLLAGTISLFIALTAGLKIHFGSTVIYALLLGALSYGFSLVFFIKALKGLGSSRTGAFFSMGPFIGAVVSILIFRIWNVWVMLPTLDLMAAGVWLILRESHLHAHSHLPITHEHPHKHDDQHHLHLHPLLTQSAHNHEHFHPELNHAHAHWPDTEHRHEH
jgi:drug/metabolite transporter (DMT)-like permease